MRYTCLLLSAAAATMLAGCVTPQNDRTTIGAGDRAVRVEALTPIPATPAGPTIAMPVGALILQEPSVVGLDRSNWATTDLGQPVDGVAHRPLYAKRVQFAGRTARQRGEYPNAETALELTGGSIWQQQAEVPTNHAMAALDLLLILPRMIWSHPWQIRWSPDVAYERTWRADRPLFLEPEDGLLEDPFAAPPPHPVTP